MKIPLTCCYLLASAGLFAGPAAAAPGEKAEAKAGAKAAGDGEGAEGVGEAESDRAQDRFSRETPEVMAAWSPVLEAARRSTARLLREGRPIALATVVHQGGWLLTKASEVQDGKGQALSEMSAEFPGGITLAVRVADVHRRHDLALLKVEASGLRPVEWGKESAPEPGSYVAAVGLEAVPVAIGVISVAARNLDETRKGFLGISVEHGEGGLHIKEVGQESAASEVGLLKDDVLISINGEAVANVSDFIRQIGSHKPYETVKLMIRRGREDKELTATLRRRAQAQSGLAEDARNALSGAISRTRSGFPAALQHDMVLEPSECGGPVVDLQGRVVGLNIARSGRIECFAIPSGALAELVQGVEAGKFARPELEELRQEVKNAEALLERVRQDAERLKGQLKEVEGS